MVHFCERNEQPYLSDPTTFSQSGQPYPFQIQFIFYLCIFQFALGPTQLHLQPVPAHSLVAGLLYYFTCRIAGQKSVYGRSSDRSPRHRFFLVSLCLQANAEMVPKTPSCHYMLIMQPSRLKFIRSLFLIYVHKLQPRPPGDSPFAVKFYIILYIIILYYIISYHIIPRW